MAPKKRLSPAECVIEVFGVRPLARDLGVDTSTPIRWRERNGGLVPSKYHKKLIAKSRGRLTPEIMVNGRAA